MAQLQSGMTQVQQEKAKLGQAMGQFQVQITQMTKRIEAETEAKRQYEGSYAQLQGQLDLLRNQNRYLSEELRAKKMAAVSAEQVGATGTQGHKQGQMEGGGGGGETREATGGKLRGS